MMKKSCSMSSFNLISWEQQRQERQLLVPG
jgi:hypothetical protein